MDDHVLFADTTAIRGYGGHADLAAEHLEASADMVEDLVGLDAAFGLIGRDFADAYARVAAAHIDAVTTLAAALRGNADAARVAAHRYRTTDTRSGARLSAAEDN